MVPNKPLLVSGFLGLQGNLSTALVARLLMPCFPSPAATSLGTLQSQAALRGFIVPADKSVQFTLLVCDVV